MWLLASGGTALAGNSSPTSLQLGPPTPSVVCRGSAATCLVTVTWSGTTDMDIYLSAVGFAEDAKVSFLPNPIRFSAGTASATATMLISTTSAILPGLHLFTVTAADRGSHDLAIAKGKLEVTLCSPGIAPTTDRGMCLAFPAKPGRTYQVQATTNLSWSPWATLCTTNAGTSDLLVFVDRDTGRSPSRFYRTVAQ